MQHYRYGFQGQEMDDEVSGEGNSVNYKYRMHNVRIGRFFAVDPLEMEYPHNGPYNFSENRVIDMVELEGLEAANATSFNYKNNITGKKGIATLSNNVYLLYEYDKKNKSYSMQIYHQFNNKWSTIKFDHNSTLLGFSGGYP